MSKGEVCIVMMMMMMMMMVVMVAAMVMVMVMVVTSQGCLFIQRFFGKQYLMHPKYSLRNEATLGIVSDRV